MSERKRHWIAGALVVSPAKIGKDIELTSTFFTPTESKVNLSIKLLDERRFGLSESEVIETSISTEEKSNWEDCSLTRRAEEVLDVRLYRRVGKFRVASGDFQRCEYVSFSMTYDERTAVSSLPENCEERLRRPDVVYLEFNKRKIRRHQPGHKSLFFLLTRNAANHRIETLVSQNSSLCRIDSAAEAFGKLFFAMISGIDSPLLLEDLGENEWTERTDSLTLKAIVFGARKHTQKQIERDRKTRFGLKRNGRKVEDEFPDDLEDRSVEDFDDQPEKVQHQKLAIIKGMIRERLRNPKHVKLAVHHLFYGKTIISLARRLGIRPYTAARAVRRAKEYLCLINSSKRI